MGLIRHHSPHTSTYHSDLKPATNIPDNSEERLFVVDDRLENLRGAVQAQARERHRITLTRGILDQNGEILVPRAADSPNLRGSRVWEGRRRDNRLVAAVEERFLHAPDAVLHDLRVATARERERERDGYDDHQRRAAAYP